MAEQKYVFTSGKMEQDLDARIVPKGSYRSANNISVNQQEGDDVGTVKTVLGNVSNTDFGLDAEEVKNTRIIGHLVDDTRKTVYVFLSNYIDTSTDGISNTPISDSTICRIIARDMESDSNNLLVEGKFLNISINSPITGVNILEDLLFFTDNRNQPRKINVTKANPSFSQNPTYYTNEDQISVAKYYPCDIIELAKEFVVSYALDNNGGGTSVSPASYYNYFTNKTILPTEAVSPSTGTGLTVRITSASSITGNIKHVEIVNSGIGYKNGDVVKILPKAGTAAISLIVQEQGTMRDRCSKYLPVYIEGKTNTSSVPNGGTVGMNFSYSGTNPSGVPSITSPYSNWIGSTVANFDANGIEVFPPGGKRAVLTGIATSGNLIVSWPGNSTDAWTVVGSSGKFVIGMNPDYDENFPGDCEYLKDKFVRFAYRFKFTDNEYSLISPFTQACFVPNQDGYFTQKKINLISTGTTSTDKLIPDTETAFESSELQFFENKVNEIELIIPCPTFIDGKSSFADLQEKMHVEHIEIIYKEDSENVLRVLDIIPISVFEDINLDVLSYEYQSKAPLRALPSSEITRVSDRVPLRALTQEIAGNRLMYGNYVDGHTSNENLNYIAGAGEKFPLQLSNLLKEYPNHTLKQNRNYQVGIVLSDRYGRQSDVILSQDPTTSQVGATLISYENSTLFHPFYSADPGLIDPIPGAVRPPDTWWGDTLSIQFNSIIPNNIGTPGYPGLYKNYSGVSNLYPGLGYTANLSLVNVSTTGGSGSGLTVDYTTNSEGNINTILVNSPGLGYEAGDLITVINSSTSTPGNFIYDPALQPNLTGWYSYKVVVKQEEQEYYNVYVPGIVNGAINKAGNSSATEASLSLFGDNINKIPKDLAEISPTQSIFNSTQNLSLRVENSQQEDNSIQFYPETKLEKVVTLGSLKDLGINTSLINSEVKTAALSTDDQVVVQTYNEDISSGDQVVSIFNSTTGTEIINEADGFRVTANVGITSNGRLILNKNFNQSIPVGSVIVTGPPGVVYSGVNNPIIALLNTSEQIGVSEENNFSPKLGVFETAPVKSLLDIYYETSTSGLVNKLNEDILIGSDTAEINSISSIGIDNWTELDNQDKILTNIFYPLTVTNQALFDNSTSALLISVRDLFGTNRRQEFKIESAGTGSFTISTRNNNGYYIGADERGTTFNFTVKLTNNGISSTKTFTGKITNESPLLVDDSGAPFNINPGQEHDADKSNGKFEIGLPASKWNRIFPGLGQPLTRDNGYSYRCFNGSADTILREKELKWNLLEAKLIDYANTPQPAGFVTGDWYDGVVDSASDVQVNWQLIKNQDYKETFFELVGDSSLATASTNEAFGSKVKIKTKATGVNATTGTSYVFDPDGTVGTFEQVTDTITDWFGNFGNQIASVFGQGNPYVSQSNVDPVNRDTDRASFISFVLFELKIECIDRSGSGASIGIQTIRVKFK
jgi:hypothetical protein